MVWCLFFFLYWCPILQNYILKIASFSLVSRICYSYLQCSDEILKEVNCLPMVARELSAWFAGALQNCSLLSKREKRKAKVCFAKDH